MLECYRFNATTYEPAKSYLQSAYEHIIAAGGDIRQLTQFAFERFGGMFVPYLCQFLCDVHEGRIQIDGLTGTGSMTIVGQPMTAGEREAMICEAAYFRAERRGFSGGCTALDDWLSAEREVDERLAAEPDRGAQRQSLSSSVAGALQELGRMQDTVTHWLGQNRGARDDAGISPQSVRSKVDRVHAPADTAARPDQPSRLVRRAAGARKKVEAAAGNGTAAGKKAGAGKKTVSRPATPAGKREAARKKATVKKRPVEARKGRLAADRKKAPGR